MLIEFYTRPGCTLCDEGRKVLKRVCGDLPWSEINVDDDPALVATYGELVPVVEVDGVRVAQWHIEEDRLRGVIRGERKRAPRRLFGRRRAR